MKEPILSSMLAIDSTPAGVWNHFWAEMERLSGEIRESLGSHLRDAGVRLTRLSRDEQSGAGEVVVGRTAFLLECPHCTFPWRPEDGLPAEVFAPAALLIRIFVYSRNPGGTSKLASLLAVDPISRTWASTDPEIGPARLDDRFAFEKFFWGFLVDRC